MIKNKIYIVKYCGGNYEDFYTVDVFATFSEHKAKKYRAKFNRILKKWKNHYSKYETIKVGSVTWIGDEYTKYYNRWDKLNQFTRCYIDEIKIK